MRHLLATLSVSLSVLASPVAAQQAGALTSAEPIAVSAPEAQAWRVRYWTSDQDGRRHEVTGLVFAPRDAAPASPRRVIAWAHGTTGVVGKCAPSLRPDSFADVPGLAEMMAGGYVVVAPDYPGLGSPMPHPYLVGRDTAYSVLDAVRAARAIPAAGAGGRFAVWGESQGGHAALWTAATARTYAPDLTLVGTAAAAPPTDLGANMREASDANARAFLLSLTLFSWSQRFGYSLDAFDKGNQGVIRRLAENNCLELGKTPKLGTLLGILSVKQTIKKKDFTRIEPFAAAMRANSVDPASVPGPVLIAQGTKDSLVAPAVTRKFAKAVCLRRTAVRWIEIPGGSHVDGARGDRASEALAWIGARFDGRAAPDDCRRI